MTSAHRSNFGTIFRWGYNPHGLKIHFKITTMSFISKKTPVLKAGLARMAGNEIQLENDGQVVDCTSYLNLRKGNGINKKN